MPAECSSCKKAFANQQAFCDACNSYCYSWDDASLPKPSTLPPINYLPANQPLFLSGLAKGVHKKKAKSDPTQATLKGVTKTRRQQPTLNRGLDNIRRKKYTVVSQYGSKGALVQIVATPSKRVDGGPSFWGIKRDGSVHPRVPTDDQIPIQYRHQQDDYESSDDDA